MFSQDRIASLYNLQLHSPDSSIQMLKAVVSTGNRVI
jgi:hypothetical protein